MESAAAIIAITGIVTTAIDKIIEIKWPNSRINSIFDVVAKLINTLVGAFVSRPKR